MQLHKLMIVILLAATCVGAELPEESSTPLDEDADIDLELQAIIAEAIREDREQRPGSGGGASDMPQPMDMQEFARPASAAEWLTSMRVGHPRLILTDERLAELKRMAESDPVLARYVQDVLRRADEYAAMPAVALAEKQRLMVVSRECLARVYSLGLAWRWTGEARYAQAGIENLKSVCSIPQWNTGSFLDVAEMIHAVSIGYDWLYHAMDDEQRAGVLNSLVSLGLAGGLENYGARPAWWVGDRFNWNIVCNSSMIIGALAVGEEHPELAGQIIPAALSSLEIASNTYEPDGAWPEGPSYWHYATRYACYGLSAMETALGRDFGLFRLRGFSQTGFFPLYLAGPTGLLFNYADAVDRSRLRPMPCLFMLAERFDHAYLAQAQHDLLKEASAEPMDVMWYRPRGEGAESALGDRFFDGEAPIAIFRNPSDSPDGMFVAFKGGFNRVNHTHLDLGSFEFDALGVRWARDLGWDDYSLPGYFDNSPSGRRWTYYRVGTASHNALLINGRNQSLEAAGHITRFVSTPESAFAIADLTAAYRGDALSVQRGVSLVANRQALLIQDEVVLAEGAEVAWGMTTDANIEAAGDVAVLSLGGRRLEARILSPSGAAFTVESAEQAAPQKLNTGVSRLMIRTPAQAGSLRIAVLLCPVVSEDAEIEASDIEPLENW